MLCSVIKHAEKWLKHLRSGELSRRETRNVVECFSLQLFRALAASGMLYNRTEHSQGLSIC